MEDISIVIRSFNEEKHIGRLLDGILHQSLKDIEIILVDSGSTDHTVAVASRYPVKILNLSSDEFSFGKSLNIGCQAARGDFIVLASAHVYPLCNDWLEELLKPFKDPFVGVCYGKQIGNEITKYSEHQVFAKWFPATSDLNQNHPFCNNANAAIRKNLWKAVPYDESLTGLEDIDWAKKIMDSGYKVAYSAGAEVVHVHTESPLRIFNRYFREAISLKTIFPQEKFSLWDFLRLFFGNVCSDSYHAFLDGDFRHLFFGIPMFRLMQFWGTYRGFAQHGPITSELKRKFYYPNTWTRTHGNGVAGRSEKTIKYEELPLSISPDD